MSAQQYVLKRENINAEFDRILEYPLTVAVASMGYGKTMAARAYLNERNLNYAWLSVDSDESSPQYIWESFANQLSITSPELGRQLRALGFPADAAQREKVLKIIEDAAYQTNTVMVIDDYHFAHSSELDKLIERIVRAGIEGFHILILSRTVPDIRIDELMLKGYCCLIKNHVFEINAGEIKKYFELYRHNISEDMARQVYDVSEGWISAAYLIMQRYAETGKLAPGKSMEKLIETAVMRRYAPREARLLYSLCVLDHFTARQAIYVSGDPEAERIIEKISGENAFVRYDEHEGVYRIHNIFNSYLRKTLEERRADIIAADLYKRSGEWCVRHDDIITGLKYFLKAEEFELIMQEFEKSSINVVFDNHSGYILDLFSQIPDRVKYRYPIGYLAYTGFYVTNADPRSGADLLSELERYYLNRDDISTETKKRIAGESMLIKAYIDFNDAGSMLRKMSRAHEMLEGRSMIANKDKIITFGSPHSMYLYYRDKGKYRWAMECVVEMFPYYTDLAGGCGKGFDDLLRAEYFLETGDLDKAVLYARKAVCKAKILDQVSVILCADFVIARAHMARGRFHDAAEIMDDLSGEAEACSSAILNSAYDLCTGYLGGLTGKEGNFSKWLQNGDMEQSEVLYQGMGFNYIVYGKYLLLRKDYIRLEVLCEEMEQTFSAFHNLLGYLHAYLLSAISKYRLFGFEAAREALLAALDIGRSDHLVLPFAEYGEFLHEMLRELQNDCGEDDYLKEIAGSAAQYRANLKTLREASPGTPSLTKRETEILRLVVEGKTNRDISAALFIAEITVRKNITSIYRKLEVNGRASAVKRALELKIM